MVCGGFLQVGAAFIGVSAAIRLGGAERSTVEVFTVALSASAFLAATLVTSIGYHTFDARRAFLRLPIFVCVGVGLAAIALVADDFTDLLVDVAPPNEASPPPELMPGSETNHPK